MCAALDCGAGIEVCDPNGIPQDVAESCPDGYEKFVKKMKVVKEEISASDGKFGN